jgi:glyoxylase-like metal-dependent hydrolase (beta-lactamase superfamily II)
VFNLGAGFATDGSQFDHHFVDGERFSIGSLPVEVMATPGHTPCSVCYRIGDALFIGDTLFAPDVGSARCDFPGGDAAVLWRSIQRILASGDDIRLCLAHDYPNGGRDPLSAISVAQMRERNIHLVGIDEAAYVALRQARDATLPAPQLLFPSLQVNIRAGQLPPPDDNGVRYLRLPLRGGW